MLLSRFLVACLIACCVANTRADQILEGFTVLKGDGYAFELKAPLGWVLDDKIGNDQGLNVVFYPEHSTWDKSDAVCFARVRSLDNRVTNVDEQVRDTVKALRENGNPKVDAKYIKTLTTQDASKAKIYYYTGDQFGNNEATAYIQAKASVHYITLSARSMKAFHDALPAFDALVTSYEDLTKPPAEVSSLFH
ncbi:MAG: hypothetical protein JOZ08_16645 [Verrucomicrobia bacterium]|nr:hypothetical protein [Verrucomicrobiota bacterium]